MLDDGFVVFVEAIKMHGADVNDKDKLDRRAIRAWRNYFLVFFQVHNVTTVERMNGAAAVWRS